jgi:anaphase-promoting complex subunit 10
MEESDAAENQGERGLEEEEEEELVDAEQGYDDDEVQDAGSNEDLTMLRELGDTAVWSVTSAKPGNGIEMLRDSDTETFWQCAIGDITQPPLAIYVLWER